MRHAEYRTDFPGMEGKQYAVQRAKAISIDPKSGAAAVIDPYEECPDEPGYLYRSVSEMECNYMGDIYAFVIYFNEPGRITGHEKVVLYRWIAK